MRYILFQVILALLLDLELAWARPPVAQDLDRVRWLECKKTLENMRAQEEQMAMVYDPEKEIQERELLKKTVNQLREYPEFPPKKCFGAFQSFYASTKKDKQIELMYLYQMGFPILRRHNLWIRVGESVKKLKLTGEDVATIRRVYLQMAKSELSGQSIMHIHIALWASNLMFAARNGLLDAQLAKKFEKIFQDMKSYREKEVQRLKQNLKITTELDFEQIGRLKPKEIEFLYEWELQSMKEAKAKATQLLALLPHS